MHVCACKYLSAMVAVRYQYVVLFFYQDYSLLSDRLRRWTSKADISMVKPSKHL